jgi:hypothetical protein
LRSLVGLTAAARGIGQFSAHGDLSLGVGLGALALALSGALLVAGCFTPIASLAVASYGVGMLLSWFPAPAATLLDSKLANGQLIVISAAVAFLGPGAFSFDSYLFGRREIVIPAAPRKKI